MEVSCPYCNNKLIKIPKRKSKCPYCKQDIYLKRKPGEDEKQFVTEAQADEIEKLWAEHYKVSLFDKLKWLGVTHERIDKVTNELKLKFGVLPGENDIIWRIYNEELMSIRDYQDKKLIYFYMSLQMQEEGKDCSKMLEYMHDCELYHWRQVSLELGDINFYNKVRITTCVNDCEACKDLQSRIYTIDEALQIKPIPYKKCMHFEGDNPYPNCRTNYMLVDD